MPFERRLAAALVLLLGTIPVLGAFLPERPDVLVAPLAVLVCTAATVLAMQARLVVAGSAALGSLAMVAFGAAVEAPPGLGYVALVPLALALAGAPIWACAAGLGTALGLALGLGGAPTASTPSLGSLGDVVGLVGLIAWAMWIAARVARALWTRRELDDLASMASTLDSGIANDAAQLWAVARRLTDAGETQRVRGAGLDEDRLQMATCLDDGTIVAAEIEGELLATLTVGHALRACACAGERDVAALRRIAQEQLDEVNDPDHLRWLALWLPEAQTWACDGETGATRWGQARLSFAAQLGRRRTREVIATHLQTTPVPAPPPIAALTLEVMLVSLLLPTALLIGAWLPPTLVPPAIGAGVPLLGALAAHAVAEQRRRSHDRRAQAAERAVEDHIDCRDDLHHGLARFLGALLPYQVRRPEAVATAHRLRGDVIGGSFADMFVDADGRLRVVAGEVAGEGIGAGFLGISAQMSLRTIVAQLDWSEATARTLALVRGEAEALRYPLHLELGMVTVDDAGVRGEGSLAGLVLHTPRSGEVRIVGALERPEHARVYISPGTSRAGPDDRAPTLWRHQISERLMARLEAGFEPGGEALPSLFSEVFDGESAPAHGTLIELALGEAAALPDAETTEAVARGEAEALTVRLDPNDPVLAA